MECVTPCSNLLTKLNIMKKNYLLKGIMLLFLNLMALQGYSEVIRTIYPTPVEVDPFNYLNIDFDNIGNVENIINDLKIIYEDYWKNFNQINTSIRLTLNIKVENLDNLKISNFEKVLNQIDLIYDFYITKFDKSYTYYQVVFNGTPNNFLKTMSYNDYKFNTQNKIWVLE